MTCLVSVNLMQLAPNVATLSEIKRNDGWVVQGHLQSPILVPIESMYAISVSE